MSEILDIREALPRDRRFIVGSWAKSYWPTFSAGVLPKRPWMDAHRKHFSNVLERPDVQSLVAFLPGAPEDFDIYGFMVWERWNWAPIVHYVYVRGEGFRGKGVGRALFHAAGVDPQRPFWTTCSSSSILKLEERRARDGKTPYNYQWDPRLLRDPEYKLHAKTALRNSSDPVVTTRRSRRSSSSFQSGSGDAGDRRDSAG